MFDIGFPELVVISIVALLVIGPEKLPETIRTISLWIGRVQRGFTNIRREIEQELGADEIRQQLHNESVMKELQQTRNTIAEVKQEVDSTIRSTRNGVRSPVPATTPTASETESQDDTGAIEPAGEAASRDKSS